MAATLTVHDTKLIVSAHNRIIFAPSLQSDWLRWCYQRLALAKRKAIARGCGLAIALLVSSRPDVRSVPQPYSLSKGKHTAGGSVGILFRTSEKQTEQLRTHKRGKAR